MKASGELVWLCLVEEEDRSSLLRTQFFCFLPKAQHYLHPMRLLNWGKSATRFKGPLQGLQNLNRLRRAQKPRNRCKTISPQGRRTHTQLHVQGGAGLIVTVLLLGPNTPPCQQARVLWGSFLKACCMVSLLRLSEKLHPIQRSRGP